MILTLLFFVLGLVALYFGAEWLVSGSSSLALRFGIAPLIVGLTVVAFGTSAPELLVSLLAVYNEQEGISVGNIVGSNIANIALILGCAAMVHPIQVDHRVLRREYPIMLLTSGLLVLFAMVFEPEPGTLQITRWEGGLLLICMAAFVIYMLQDARKTRSAARGAAAAAKEDAEEAAEALAAGEELPDPSRSTVARDVGLTLLGITGLAVGAHFLVESAVTIAKTFGISELVIGISIVAVGTSLPELATSVVAASRKESDISVGNVVGSNIFNVALVIGLVAVIMPISLADASVKIDLWVMLATAILIWPLMRSGLRITRGEGAMLVAGYGVYMVYLFMRSAA